jgi:hypothetical protein
MQRMGKQLLAGAALAVAGFAVGALWFGGVLSPKLAAGPAGSVGATGGEIIAFASEVNGGANQALFFLDPKQKIFSIYDYDVRKGKLKLAAVRHFAADQQLAEFNNEPPYVAEIEKLIRQR